MRADAELPVVQATYDFVVWLIPKIGKFPRDLRFTLGEKIERQSLEILEGLIRARYQSEKIRLLSAVNVELEVLRFLLRAAHDLKALPPKAFGDSAKRLVDIGRQIGLWTNSCERRTPP
jgi:hypothetical protein